MVNLKTCPICSSRSIRQLSQMGFAPIAIHEVMPGVKIDAAIITRYSVCHNCHVIFQNPRMSNEELDKFYREGFYRRLLNMTDKEKDDDEMQRAKFDSKIIKENLGKVESHLDIGASRGFLLREVGAKLKVAVEQDIKHVTVSGIKAYSQIKNVPLRSFDLVTAIHTLEHVPDPVGFLEEMIKKVAENGHLIIEVPTWKSPGGPLRLPHLFHFEPDVLRLLCKRVGLKTTSTHFTPHLMLICKLQHS